MDACKGAQQTRTWSLASSSLTCRLPVDLPSKTTLHAVPHETDGRNTRLRATFDDRERIALGWPSGCALWYVASLYNIKLCTYLLRENEQDSNMWSQPSIRGQKVKMKLCTTLNSHVHPIHPICLPYIHLQPLLLIWWLSLTEMYHPSDVHAHSSQHHLSRCQKQRPGAKNTLTSHISSIPFKLGH